MEFKSVIHFWFEELTPKQWWMKDAALDQSIRTRFHEVHQQAVLGELSDWRENAEGALAEIIVLDQFSRNLYRNHKNSFAMDGMALALAQEAIRRRLNDALPPVKRAFLYLPFMHSESLKIHKQALELFAEPGLEDNLQFEQQHADIIKKFGRYPHRNEVLERISTEEERQFIRTHPGF